MKLPERGQGKRKTAGTFVDISLDDISHIIMRKNNLSKDNVFRFVTVFGGDDHAISGGPALEIGCYERSARIKRDITSVFDLLIVLGDPMFNLQSTLSEQITKKRK